MYYITRYIYKSPIYLTTTPYCSECLALNENSVAISLSWSYSFFSP